MIFIPDTDTFSMGADQSRTSLVWQALDVHKRGFITHEEVEPWFRDECFLGNALFSPHLNGVTDVSQLALSFVANLDADRDQRISHEEFSNFCSAMTEEQLKELTLTVGDTDENKKRVAVTRIFEALDFQQVGNWTNEAVDMFVRTEVRFRAKKNATAASGVKDGLSKEGDENDPSQEGKENKTLSIKCVIDELEAAMLQNDKRRKSHVEIGSDKDSNVNMKGPAQPVNTDSTLPCATEEELMDLPPVDTDHASIVHALPRPLNLQDLIVFFKSWTLRDIRVHFEQLVQEALHQRTQTALRAMRSRKSHERNASTESATPGESATNSCPVGDVAIESSHLVTSLDPNAIPSFPSSTEQSVPTSLTLVDYSLQLTTMHDEIVSLNAQQKQMNEEMGLIENALLHFDSARITVMQSLDDAQRELHQCHERQSALAKEREQSDEKLKKILRDYERCAEEGHRLSREIEVTRETVTSMKNELEQLNNKQKALPEHLKTIDRNITEQKIRMETARKAQKDARHMANMLESETTAQHQRLESLQSSSSPSMQSRQQAAQEQAALTRLRSKLNAYVTTEREKQQECASCEQLLQKLEEEKNGDEALSRLTSKMQLYRAGILEKQEHLNKFVSALAAQEKEQQSLDNQRRQAFAENNALRKSEKALQLKVSQITNNYAASDAHLYQLGVDKNVEIEKSRLLLTLQAEHDRKMEELLVELEFLCKEVHQVRQEEDEKKAREEADALAEAELYKREMEVKESHGWRPDETHVAPLPYRREPERADDWSYCAVVHVERMGRLVQCVAHINKFLLTVDNIVRSRQHPEEAVRVCVDVLDVIDVKLKADDLSGRPTISLNTITNLPQTTKPAAPVKTTVASLHNDMNIPSSVGTELESPRVADTHKISLPIALPVPRKSGRASVEFSPPLVHNSGTSSETLSTPSAQNTGLHVSIEAPKPSPSNSSTTNTRIASSLPDPDIYLPPVARVLSQPVSPPIFSSVLHEEERAQLTLEPTVLALVLRSGYRNRLLLSPETLGFLSSSDDLPPPLEHIPNESKQAGRRTSLSRTSIHLSPNSSSQQAALSRLNLLGNSERLCDLFRCLKVHIENRNKAQTLLEIMTALPLPPEPVTKKETEDETFVIPPLDDDSLDGSVPLRRRIEETPEERKARRKAKREAKERELQRQRDLKAETEEVYIYGASEIIPAEFFAKLIRATPVRFHLSVWKLVYSMTRHGVSFTHFMSVLSKWPCALLIIRDMKGGRFGGFTSPCFTDDASITYGFYGSGESWVFRVAPKSEEEKRFEERTKQSSIIKRELVNVLHEEPEIDINGFPISPPVPLAPEPQNSVVIYRWSGLNDYFLFTGRDPRFIAMGGGELGYAWRLDQNFRFGKSGNCATFESPLLAATSDWQAAMFEVWCPVRGRF